MEKKCKNKKCQRILPEGYKDKYCENCRNEHAETIKTTLKGIGGTALGIGLFVVSAGKFGGGKKS